MTKTKEEVSAYQRRWYLNNRESKLQKQKEKREQNRGDRKRQNTDSLVGNRFGRLVVLSESLRAAVSGTRRRTYCLCKCDCGGTVEIQRTSLLSKNSRSCGCARIEHLKGRRLRPYEYIYNLLVARTKKRDGIVCDITYEDFVRFTEIGACHYCGEIVQWAANSKDRDKLGHGHHLDRMDNDKPYSKENCVVCCRRCNWGKGDMFSYEEWETDRRGD